MTERLATTPFGGGRMSATTFALQQKTAQWQSALATGADGNDSGQADKWELMRSMVDARRFYGLSDRTLTVLDALLSFHPERLLDGRNPIIVFPSNHELSQRARGMSQATLRRHIAALVTAGLLLRRDSPNGKRYCLRESNGTPGSAFGFDLAPFALAANAIHAQAETVRAQARTIRTIRAEITLHLRDIAKTLQAAMGEGRPGDWSAYLQTLEQLSGRLTRSANGTGLVERRDALIRLRARVEKTYLESMACTEPSACDAENERHIQNTNTESKDSLSASSMETAERSHEEMVCLRPRPANRTPETASHPAGNEAIALPELLRAFPTLRDYALNGITNWREARATTELVRSMLGITPSAWRDALNMFGEVSAIVVIAAILERAGEIRSPGGYLRELTARARSGKFKTRSLLKQAKTAA